MKINAMTIWRSLAMIVMMMALGGRAKADCPSDCSLYWVSCQVFSGAFTDVCVSEAGALYSAEYTNCWYTWQQDPQFDVNFCVDVAAAECDSTVTYCYAW
jgi:hypothetical protein